MTTTTTQPASEMSDEDTALGLAIYLASGLTGWPSPLTASKMGAKARALLAAPVVASEPGVELAKVLHDAMENLGVLDVICVTQLNLSVELARAAIAHIGGELEQARKVLTAAQGAALREGIARGEAVRERDELLSYLRRISEAAGVGHHDRGTNVSMVCENLREQAVAIERMTKDAPQTETPATCEGGHDCRGLCEQAPAPEAPMPRLEKALFDAEVQAYKHFHISAAARADLDAAVKPWRVYTEVLRKDLAAREADLASARAKLARPVEALTEAELLAFSDTYYDTPSRYDEDSRQQLARMLGELLRAKLARKPTAPGEGKEDG